MKLCFTIFTCVLILAGTACKKRTSAPDPNQLYYTETQCSSNPWNKMTVTLVTESATEQIKNWLYQNSITPVKITFAINKDAVLCYACSCPTGRTVWVVFDASDIEKAKSLGFLERK